MTGPSDPRSDAGTDARSDPGSVPETPTATFERLRPVLLGLAYRLLGSMWDAEDVVGDAYLRWVGVDADEVREPRAFLITVVSRLALDRLRSARATREAYVGPWLPEPVSLDDGPLDVAERRDALSYATLHLMERLSPPERGVFVLREAFGLPYEEIAGILSTTAANARQLLHRAHTHLGEQERFRPSDAEHTRLLTGFLAAAGAGDLEALAGMLTDDARAWTDGGGRTRAALRPILGREKVVAFVAGLARRYPVDGTQLVEANGRPAVRLRRGELDQLVLLDVRDGRIATVFAVLNPDKLSHV